jgi:hypothetical protein
LGNPTRAAFLCVLEGEVLVNPGLAWATVGVLAVLSGIGVWRTFRGEAVFFSGYGDLFLGYVPLVVTVVGWLNSDRPWSPYLVGLSVAGILGYHYVRAFQENYESKFLAACIGTGRIVLGYLIPLLMFFIYLDANGKPRREGETESEYELRRSLQKLEAAIFIAGLAYFLSKLVNQSVQTRERKRYLETNPIPAPESESSNSLLSVAEPGMSRWDDSRSQAGTSPHVSESASVRFRYRWMLQGQEYRGEYSCKDEAALEEHIREMGGQLLEILERDRWCAVP